MFHTRVLFILCVSALFLAPAVLSQQGKKPLSVEEIEGLLRKGVRPKRVAVLIEEHGVNFEPTEEAKRKLRGAGADIGVIQAVERARTASKREPTKDELTFYDTLGKPFAGQREISWTVQVNAYPEEKSAQRLVERLKEKGYDAYMVLSNVKGRTWYRVRVGKFATRDEAKKAQEDLQTKEHLTKTVTVSN